MGQRNQYQSQGVARAPPAAQTGQRGQIMGRGQGQGSQDRTLRTQGRVYAMVPQAESSDQLDMEGTFYTCNCYLMHHVHYYILCDGFGLGS